MPAVDSVPLPFKFYYHLMFTIHGERYSNGIIDTMPNSWASQDVKYKS